MVKLYFSTGKEEAPEGFEKRVALAPPEGSVDEIIIVDNFKKELRNHYSMYKIYAMMNETEPYILLDFDTVLELIIVNFISIDINLLIYIFMNYS